MCDVDRVCAGDDVCVGVGAVCSGTGDVSVAVSALGKIQKGYIFITEVPKPSY